MASEHMTDQALAWYLTGGLDRLEMAMVKGHCKECETCRRRLTLMGWSRFLQRKPVTTRKSLAYGDCFSAATLERYENGQLTAEERAEVEQHLGTCAVCRAELELVRYTQEHPGEEQVYPEWEEEEETT